MKVNIMGMSETLKAISDPVRRNILEMLKKEKMTAGDIANKFNLTNSTVSYHLSYLKKADLVKEEKYKKYIYYKLNTSVFEEIMVWIYQFGKENMKGDNNDEEKDWLENFNYNNFNVHSTNNIWSNLI